MPPSERRNAENAPRGSRVSARKDNSFTRPIAGTDSSDGEKWKRMIKGMARDVYRARRTKRAVDETGEMAWLNPPHALTQ